MSDIVTVSATKELLECLQVIKETVVRQEAAMQELRFWFRLGRQDQAKELFETVLNTDRKRWVYESLDGGTSLPEIKKRTGVDPAQSSPWGQAWEDLGIVVDVGGGTRRKVIPLSSVGVEVPPLP